MSECRCGRPTKDDAYVCEECLDKLARALGDVPWVEEELETTISKQRAMVAGEGAASAKCSCKDDDDKCQHALVPYHVKAAEKRDALRHELVQLVRFCSEEGIRSSDPSDTLPANTMRALSRWLMWRVDGLAFNDMAEEFVGSLVAAVSACQRIIDLPPERSYAGPCPECKSDLYHRPNAADVKCPGCGQVYEVAKIATWMRARIEEHMADRLVTAHEGATLLSRFGLETGQRTIDKWHERGLIAEAGHVAPDGKRARRLYRWDDLLALAARHARAS